MSNFAVFFFFFFFLTYRSGFSSLCPPSFQARGHHAVCACNALPSLDWSNHVLRTGRCWFGLVSANCSPKVTPARPSNNFEWPSAKFNRPHTHVRSEVRMENCRPFPSPYFCSADWVFSFSVSSPRVFDNRVAQALKLAPPRLTRLSVDDMLRSHLVFAANTFTQLKVLKVTSPKATGTLSTNFPHLEVLETSTNLRFSGFFPKLHTLIAVSPGTALLGVSPSKTPSLSNVTWTLPGALSPRTAAVFLLFCFFNYNSAKNEHTVFKVTTGAADALDKLRSLRTLSLSSQVPHDSLIKGRFTSLRHLLTRFPSGDWSSFLKSLLSMRHLESLLLFADLVRHVATSFCFFMFPSWLFFSRPFQPHIDIRKISHPSLAVLKIWPLSRSSSKVRTTLTESFLVLHFEITLRFFCLSSTFSKPNQSALKAPIYRSCAFSSCGAMWSLSTSIW